MEHVHTVFYNIHVKTHWCIEMKSVFKIVQVLVQHIRVNKYNT